MSNASSIPPLSYATYRLHPDILTRFSDPASTLQSFDGRVGAVLPNDYLISSPNSNVLYAPPLSSRRVRLRRHFHFSHDDPLFYPQPFDETRPHLPLIRTPSPDPNHPFAAAWLIPSAEDFDAEASDFLYNAVVLDTTVYLRLKALADDVLKTINLSEFQSDPYLTQGSLQVDRMLSLLQVAAPHARIQYRSQDWNTVIIGKKRNYEIPDCLAVIGAFTDNIKNTPDAQIDRVASLIAEDSSRIIELPSGFRVDGTDAEPSHKIIWEGPTNKPECFVAMNAYLQSLLYPSSVFGSHQMQSLSSFQKAISTRATLNHSAGHASSSGLNHPNSTLRSSMRPAPSTTSQARDQYLLQLKSPAMPPAISAWARALEYHSTYNQSLRRPETLESGYFLPPPRLLDGPANPSTRAFITVAGSRFVRLFTISRRLTKPVNLSAKQWRCLLDVVGGHAPSTSTQTKNAILRNEMRIVVETLITQSSSHSLNLDDPTPQIEEFAGQPVDCKNEPPPRRLRLKSSGRYPN
ncbi:hypothetical protein C8R42DRAFT_729717 [Lentinula raphanica]|nr:hypothetical protein C8R42DRAFT_729717 [Lentinula raphanica]